MSFATPYRQLLSHIPKCRHMHSSAVRTMPRMTKATATRGDDLVDALLDFKTPQTGNDTSSAGHMMLQQQRRMLYYLRLIEHEMPRLVGELGHIYRINFSTQANKPSGSHLGHLNLRNHSLCDLYRTEERSTQPR